MERLPSFNRAGHKLRRGNVGGSSDCCRRPQQLSRVRLRVSGLFMALHEAMPPGHTAGLPKAESELPRYIAMMNDQFTVADNGDVKVELPPESLG